MFVVNLIAFIILLIGALNWGLIGIFNWNLVGAITGGGYNAIAAIIYILVFISALWLIYAFIIGRGRIEISPRDYSVKEDNKRVR